MEKYSQFRDRGTGIAPFLPIPSEPAGIRLPLHCFLFAVRIPLLLSISLIYFVVLQWLPFASVVRKGVLWTLLGIQGTWWQDLQIDGVKRGSLARNEDRLPRPGSIIASSFTSPLDCLYLAAIFDPVFTVSYPRTRLLRRISLFQAITRAMKRPESMPPKGAHLTDLATLLLEVPDSSVVVLPECTTTNGRGILQLSPSLLTAPPTAKIFPVSLRYTPGDITTPLPTSCFVVLWRACAKPAHCIRVRIAEYVYSSSNTDASSNALPSVGKAPVNGVNGSQERSQVLSAEERKTLDRIGEALARLGRAKRVALGVEDKEEFIGLRQKRP